MSRPYLESSESRQLWLLREQLSYCRAHVPWYRQRFDELGIEPESFMQLSDLQYLPIISKSDVRADYGAFFSERYDRQRCHSSTSSGTTGEPFRTYFDGRSWYRKKIWNKLVARKACGMRPGQRTAILDCDDSATLAAKNRRVRFARPLMHVRVLSMFCETSSILADLQEFQPHNIYGYPSHLLRLAACLGDRGRSLGGVQQIFTSSESLAPGSRARIEAAFNAPVFDIYGSTEFKEVAWQCREQGGYHINTGEVICEIVGGGASQAGAEPGDIVITDLRNRAMPLLRFRIGDRGRRVLRPCECGREQPMIEPLSGRDSDYVSLPGGREVSGYLLTTAVEGLDGLVHYRVVQDVIDRLTVHTVWDHLPGADELERLRSKVSGLTDGLLSVDVKVLPVLPVDSGAKHKVIVNRTLDSTP